MNGIVSMAINHAIFVCAFYLRHILKFFIYLYIYIFTFKKMCVFFGFQKCWNMFRNVQKCSEMFWNTFKIMNCCCWRDVEFVMYPIYLFFTYTKFPYFPCNKSNIIIFWCFINKNSTEISKYREIFFLNVFYLFVCMSHLLKKFEIFWYSFYFYYFYMFRDIEEKVCFTWKNDKSVFWFVIWKIGTCYGIWIK